MKTKLAVILAITVVFLWPLQVRSQQSQQPLKHFGYIGATTDSDLNRVRSYTDFTFVSGEYGQSIVDLSTRVKNNGMRVVIDLGRVLWCQQDQSIDLWHLCYYNADVNYLNRWNNWISMNGSVLNSNYVLAFSVITEPTKRGISTADVETAVALVKQTYPQIPTLVVEGSDKVIEPAFEVPTNADWIGIFAYYTHPNLDYAFKESVRVLKLKKQAWQRTAYALDGFYGPSHLTAARTVADMDTIAQEWYTIASNDPDAILLSPFLWADLPSEGAIGSVSFPQNVLDKHAAIGAAILAGRFPTYQGSFDRIDCQSLAGWAWDTSQPNTPVSVDIYDSQQKIATVRANQFRQDLLNAGIGNGQHGFSFNLPASLRNGQTHWIGIRHGGLERELNSSPRSIICAAPPSYEGSVEVAGCGSIVGWAADRSRLNTSITVSIFDGPTFVTSVLASDLRTDIGGYLGDNGRHGFTMQPPARFYDGLPHSLKVKFESSATELGASPRTITCTASPSASIAWIRPSEVSWGPPNTMTVAGYAQNGSGGVQLVWRDLTMAGPWNVVSWQPTPSTVDNTWSNTIPSSNRCHTYSAYVNYSGVQSPVFTYNGLNSGYCTESARVIWIQPQSTAGFGPPGSLVVAGSATGAPSGTQVYLWYRDITAGTGLIRLNFAALPGSDGVWYNAIENANPFHQYEVYATYDVFTSSTCTYAGNNSPTSCP